MAVRETEQEREGEAGRTDTGPTEEKRGIPGQPARRRRKRSSPRKFVAEPFGLLGEGNGPRRDAGIGFLVDIGNRGKEEWAGPFCYWLGIEMAFGIGTLPPQPTITHLDGQCLANKIMCFLKDEGEFNEKI